MDGGYEKEYSQTDNSDIEDLEQKKQAARSFGVDTSQFNHNFHSSEDPNQKGFSHLPVEKNSELADIDRELEELLQKQHSKVKVFGVGGAGGNTISRMKEIGIKGGEFIALNTDAQDLLYSNADHKILIGKELTMGLGAGSDPRVGEEAAHESEQEIKKKLAGSDMIFITCGFGGGTGSGAAHVVAGLAKKQGALTIGVVTLPFTIEGRKRIENAEYALERMESMVDTLIVIPNDKLLEIAPELPLQTAFKVADEILTNAVKGITELVTKSGLVNLDFADVKAVMVNGGVSLIGMGESDSANRAQEAIEKAITNPLIDVDISNSTGALVNIIGGNDMSLDESRAIISIVGDRLSPDAKMIWGAQLSPEMDKSIRVMIIITGVKSSQIMGSDLPPEIQKQVEIEDELGIEFLE
ncbi:cell division protein FtsZ [Candidatus Pacearchaeota archaeon]|nr:cell division protein FtsZ [Candidatus Pacearchaeota archaeon]